jgi:acyl carrier protein
LSKGQRMVSAALVEQGIITGLAKVLKRQPSQIQKESRLIEDLMLDSLDILDLVFKLEEDFNIEIPETELRFVTVQDVIAYVQEKTKGG